jgi:hypothetical protein
MTPEELVAVASPILARVGAAFYFDPETRAVGKQLGLDGFRFYFLGRGGVLGDVEPSVVQSAFGYFQSDLVEKMWTSARERTALSPREAGRAFVGAGHEYGRRHFSELGGLEAFNQAAESVVRDVDPAGLSLFAALSSEPLPPDEPARAMQLASVLRELRGSIHLVAVVASGLPARVAHGFRRPDDFETFGYSSAEAPEIDDELLATIANVDEVTDRRMAAAFSPLDKDARRALAAGAEAMLEAVEASGV